MVSIKKAFWSCFLTGLFSISFCFGRPLEVKPIKVDVCIYGGTAAGVIAAVQLAKLGHKVILVEPGWHVGGIAVDGLGGTDINNHREFKNDAAVGGMSLEFYQKVADHYGIENFLDKRIDPTNWRFESSVADSIYDSWLSMYDIPIYYGTEIIFDQDAVEKEGNVLKKIKMDNGLQVEAKYFMDASIEGDLLHYAGISTFIGRESNSLYNETKNGIRVENTFAQFKVKVDPYKLPGDPKSGLIPTIFNEPIGEAGFEDKRLQAYCFRVCLTQDASNMVPIPKPENYDPGQYEIYLRYFEAGGSAHVPRANLPNGKTDFNGGGDLSHNLYGYSHEYPGGSKQKRAEIYEYHKNFTQGLFYFLSNDPKVPLDIRNRWSSWGLCKDEFVDNDHWPRKLYVRDARRMVSDYVITEHHTRKIDPESVKDPVGVAYWPPDVHHVRRIVKDGYAYNEGFVFGGDEWVPFGISYRSLIPRREEAINIITPTCPSSSHIAYGAIRIEWTFMVLGQSAALALDMAIKNDLPVQDVPYDRLKKILLENNQVLELKRM
ncbi:MAG: FAD-dependent oxidoreductase [Cyclobacteriaceae bacterium]|nr:FAD-dependent oxidoreductase [Cyclobacteriaceae bacterium SS2]